MSTDTAKEWRKLDPTTPEGKASLIAHLEGEVEQGARAIAEVEALVMEINRFIEGPSLQILKETALIHLAEVEEMLDTLERGKCRREDLARDLIESAVCVHCAHSAYDAGDGTCRATTTGRHSWEDEPGYTPPSSS